MHSGVDSKKGRDVKKVSGHLRTLAVEFEVTLYHTLLGVDPNVFYGILSLEVEVKQPHRDVHWD